MSFHVNFAIALVLCQISLYSASPLVAVDEEIASSYDNLPYQVNVMPGIQYLGAGYDIVRGNPMPTDNGGPDRGILRPIFDLNNFSEGNKGTSKFYDVPDGTIARDCHACQLLFQSTTIENSYQYTNTLKEQASQSTSVGVQFSDIGSKASFKSSNTYENTVTDLSGYANVLIDTRAKCSTYCYTIDDYFPPKLDRSFVRAVQELPNAFSTDSEKAEYFKFIKRSGTHFIGYMQSGSLYWQRSKVSNQNYSRMEETMTKTEIEKSAELKFGDWFTSGSESKKATTQEQKNFNSFSQSVSQISMHVLGAAPKSSNGGPVDLAQWQEDTLKWLMPIEYRLSPIEMLFSTTLFPEDQISLKRSALVLALNEYCQYVGRELGKPIVCSLDHSHKELKWVSATANGIAPLKPVISDGRWHAPFAVCRFQSAANELVIGHTTLDWVTANHLNFCFGSCLKKECNASNFEMLTNPNKCKIEWSRGAGGPNSVKGGYDESNQPYFVGRHLDMNYHPFQNSGSISPARNAFYDVWKPAGSVDYETLETPDCSVPM